MKRMSYSSQIPAIIISATHSGAGKTTVTRALLTALNVRGLAVQPFKIGPDFIDPMYHSAIVGRPSVNLDYWMMGEAGIRDVFSRWTRNADVAVIEGMGALFDGANGTGEGSAAHIAAILSIPVVAVIDVYGMTRTTAAIMDGISSFDHNMNIAGFILNRCGYAESTVHMNLIRDAIGPARWSRVLSVVSNSPALEVAERHLGLITTYENSASGDNSSLNYIAEQIDVDRIFRSSLKAKANSKSKPQSARLPIQQPTRPQCSRLAVAHDAAFCFYYEENLAALKAAGFEIVEFSPVRGDTLPPGTDAVYFGGGYPESFARELADNVELAAQLRRAADLGMPIYGECGGLIYLGRSLTGFDGKTYSMSGILPVDFMMDPAHLKIRYIELTTRGDSLLGPAGTVIRGQEFHQSRVASSELSADLYAARTSDGHEYMDGYQYKNVVASYAHIYFNSCAGAASSFVEAARSFTLLTERA
jgi:cobyrinic acid a,c-diamide synthase